jgi:hypothetical protein
MSDLKIVSFDSKSARKQEVVDKARHILKLAEAGQIVDLSFSAAKADGSVITGFTATDDAPRRIVAVSMLLHRLHVVADSQSELDA